MVFFPARPLPEIYVEIKDELQSDTYSLSEGERRCLLTKEWKRLVWGLSGRLANCQLRRIIRPLEIQCQSEIAIRRAGEIAV